MSTREDIENATEALTDFPCATCEKNNAEADVNDFLSCTCEKLQAWKKNPFRAKAAAGQ